MTQAKDGGEVRALKADGDDRVQGLLATTDEADSKYVYVVLVESAPFNRSQKKEYNGVGAHLFAEAVKISYELGYNGVVAFDAKTELFEYYTKAMYATRLGTSQRMIIDEAGAKNFMSGITEKTLDDFAVLTIPPWDCPKTYDVRAAIDYCKEKGITTDQMTEEETLLFESPNPYYRKHK